MLFVTNLYAFYAGFLTVKLYNNVEYLSAIWSNATNICPTTSHRLSRFKQEVIGIFS